VTTAVNTRDSTSSNVTTDSRENEAAISARGVRFRAVQKNNEALTLFALRALAVYASASGRKYEEVFATS